MNFDEEMARLERKYKELLADDLLSKKQRKDMQELRELLKGHLYDPQFLADWVKSIPFDGTWDKGLDTEVSLHVVGVIASWNDFYYVGYDLVGSMHIVLCNDHYIPADESIKFPEMPKDKLKRKVMAIVYPDDILIMFRTDKNAKKLIE